MKLLFGIAIVLVAFNSCKKEVKVDFADAEPTPVLNVLMNEDSLIDARLTFSRNKASSGFEGPASAKVCLYENNIFKEELQPGEKNGLKYYRSHTPVHKGKTYKVTAEVAGYPLVEGSDIIPPLCKLSAPVLDQQVDNEGWEHTHIKFNLTDEAGQNNYYRFRLFSTDNQKLYFTSSNSGQTNNVGGLVDDDEYFNAMFMNDVLFADKSMEIVLSFTGTGDSVLLEVTSLTEPSYKYLKSIQDAENLNGNVLTEPFPIYTNITNGLGIVGGISVKRLRVTK